MEKKIKQPTYEQLLHYYHSTCGLWAIDRNPQEVDTDWIRKNAFRLESEDITQMKKKEFAVGEEFQFGLKRLKCVKAIGCRTCVFYRIDDCRQQLGHFIGECEPILRDDNESVIFIEVE